MSAEITSTDTMMYVREVPWHGLGTRVEEAPNSADAIRLAGIDWTVESNPVYDNRGQEIPNYKANTRSSDGSVLGIVSNRYKIVQNKDAFSFTDALLQMEDEEVRYETAGSLSGGKTIWLLARMEDRKILGDTIVPYICFRNTHDGKGSIKVCATPIRVVCNNTLNLALSEAVRTWTTRHVGDLDAKLEEAKMTLGFAKDYMNELEHKAESMANIKISDGELEYILDTMYPVNAETSERKLRNIDAIKSNFFRCYGMSDISQFKGTLWGAINAATDFADHVAPARMTTTYQENNWDKIMIGHPFVDNMYALLTGSKTNA